MSHVRSDSGTPLVWYLNFKATLKLALVSYVVVGYLKLREEWAREDAIHADQDE
jgi:hypothetical protein